MAQVSNRDKLLQAAIVCLQEKGYARTTARDIATAADANLASIGYHFGSKEGLLNEALWRSFEAWTEELVRRTLEAGEVSPLERMATSWKVMLDSFPECRPLLLAFVESMAQSQRSEELRAQLAEHYQKIRETIAETVAASLGERGLENGVDAEVVASFLIAICDGLTLQWLLDPERTPTGDELTASLGGALMSALQADAVQ